MADIVEQKLVISDVLVGLLQDFSSKITVLNYLFRCVSFTDNKNRISPPSKSDINIISHQLNIPFHTVDMVIRDFLINNRSYKQMLNFNGFTWHNDMHKLNRKLRIYLHKAHRLAPIFDYNRVRMNINSLIKLMRRRCYIPRFTTQLAVLIFVTDQNAKSKMYNKPILQKNLRAFCNCSAYAFHRARNRLRINNQGKIY